MLWQGRCLVGIHLCSELGLEAAGRHGGGWSWAAFGYDRVRSVSEADFLPAPCVGSGCTISFEGIHYPCNSVFFWES